MQRAFKVTIYCREERGLATSPPRSLMPTEPPLYVLLEDVMRKDISHLRLWPFCLFFFVFPSIFAEYYDSGLKPQHGNQALGLGKKRWNNTFRPEI